MIEKYLAEWLKDHGTLEGEIRGVHPVNAPQRRRYPCLVYSQDDFENDARVESAGNELAREQVEVMVLGKEIKDVDRVGRLLEASPIHGFRGSMKGAWIQALFVRQENPEQGRAEPSGDETPLIERRYVFTLIYQTSDVPALT